MVDQVNQMALRDDYRNEELPTKESHRMSRKKRRRMQALEEVEPEDMKTNSAIKKVKLASRDKKEVQKEKTMAEMGIKKGVKNEKIRRPVFAVGGLDQDMLDWNGGGSGGKINRKAAERDAREGKFTDFDPNKKLRKGGKIGMQSFKSKSKFKRRK
ncbi:unnamed protein product [Symbiodinium microadriaticum]|nr:unnamed protein product [Symbiodinium microadriaticum]